jgi:hypothetical protein
MDTPLPVLKANTVRQLMPYSAADDARIRNAIGFMSSGQNKPGKLRPRHCISAARLAVTQLAEQGALTGELLNAINDRAMELVRANAPVGLRGGDTSTPHKSFIAQFADQL